MLSIKSAIASALCLIALSDPLSAAPLAYRFPAGSTFTLSTATDAEVPVVGTKHLELSAAVKCESADASGMKLSQSVQSGSTRVDLGCTLSPEGRIGDITGVNLNDPKFALIAKNATMALPPLPNDEVSVGMTWQDEKPLYLPPAPIPGVPESVRIQSSYKVTGIEKADGAERVTISVVTNQSPGQKLTVHAEGAFVLEAGTGRPISSTLKGEATIKVLFKTFHVPFNTTMRAQ